MKKMRYIPVLALTALLTGCNLFGGDKIKAPSFAKEGEEVAYSEFKDVLEEAKEVSEISDTDSLLGDRVIKGKVTYVNSSSWKRGKKDLEKTSEQMVYATEYQFDLDNIAAKMTGEIKQSRKSEDQEGNSSNTSNSKVEYHYQVETIRSAKSVVQANAKTNTYYVVNTYPNSYNSEDALDDLLRSNYNSVYLQFLYSIPSSTSEAKDYMFFINSNDTLFTFSQTLDDEQQDSIYSTVRRVKFKAQLDLTDKKQALRISSESKTEYTYKRDSGSFQEGDVVTEESKAYTEVTFASKNVSVKQIDISEYTLES